MAPRQTCRHFLGFFFIWLLQFSLVVTVVTVLRLLAWQMCDGRAFFMLTNMANNIQYATNYKFEKKMSSHTHTHTQDPQVVSQVNCRGIIGQCLLQLRVRGAYIGLWRFVCFIDRFYLFFSKHLTTHKRVYYIYIWILCLCVFNF